MNESDYRDVIRLLLLAGLTTGSLQRAEELCLMVGRLREARS